MKGLNKDMFDGLVSVGEEYIFALVDSMNNCIIFHGSEVGKQFLKKRPDFLENFWQFCKNEVSNTENLCLPVKITEFDMRNTSDDVLKDNSSNGVEREWSSFEKSFIFSRDNHHQHHHLSPVNINNNFSKENVENKNGNTEAFEDLFLNEKTGKDKFDLPNSNMTCTVIKEEISLKNPQNSHPQEEHTSVFHGDTTEKQNIIQTGKPPSAVKKQHEFLNDIPEILVQHNSSNEMLENFSQQNSSKETEEKLAKPIPLNGSPEMMEKQIYPNETSEKLEQDCISCMSEKLAQNISSNEKVAQHKSSNETLHKSDMIKRRKGRPSKTIKSIVEEEDDSSNNTLESIKQQFYLDDETENSNLIKRRRQRSSSASSVKSVISEQQLGSSIYTPEELMQYESSYDTVENSTMIKKQRVRPRKSQSITSPSLKEQCNSSKYVSERGKKKGQSKSSIYSTSKVPSGTSGSINEISQSLSDEEEKYDDFVNIKSELNSEPDQSNKTSKTTMKCNICQKVFKTMRGYIIHSERKICMQVFKCDECGNLYKHAGDLERHVKTNHRKLFTVMCELCGKLFRCSKVLNDHVKFVHNKVMHFECHICHREFQQNSHYQKHLMKHTTEIKWMCEECGKYYSSRNILNRHLRIHREEKKFKCEVCSRAFVQCHGLTRHMRTHTGQKPYCCRLCPATFAHNVSLKTHMRNSHSGQVSSMRNASN